MGGLKKSLKKMLDPLVNFWSSRSESLVNCFCIVEVIYLHSDIGIESTEIWLSSGTEPLDMC